MRRVVAGAVLAVAALLAMAQLASAETRTLKLYYLHTGEKAEITFKKNGKYIPSGLKQLNYFLRDWRRNEPTKMDPRLFDVVWETYRAVGGRDYIHVVSAYRSPATNAMLRKRTRGVAEKSQHMLGKAMDFFIPGVKLRDIRYAGLRLGAGGVGYYPTSGSPFVHLDVGNVRHWPKMSRSELVSVFPKGNTMHVPSDGKPLPGYNAALAAYQKRQGAPISVASAETSKRSGGFFSRMFGGGADEEEENSTDFASAKPAARPAARVAAAAPQPPASLPGVTNSAPAAAVAVPAAPVAEPAPDTQTIIAALPLREVPRPLAAPRPSVDVGTQVAAAEPPPAPVALIQQPEPPQAVAVAENVPIPMHRPNYTAPATVLAEAVAPVPAQVPVAETAMNPRAPTSRGEMAIESIIAADSELRTETGVPMPMARPHAAPQVEIAALAPARSTPARNTLVNAPATARTDRVAPIGSRPFAQRDALRGIESDPVATVTAGPVTTRKSAKPGPSDLKPEPKAVSKPVQLAALGRVIARDRPAAVEEVPRPDGKAFAVHSLMTSPAEVYTAGFQQTGALPDPKRFSGKAVTFMPVAKFEQR